jgi:hypothetical protein
MSRLYNPKQISLKDLIEKTLLEGLFGTGLCSGFTFFRISCTKQYFRKWLLFKNTSLFCIEMVKSKKLTWTQFVSDYNLSILWVSDYVIFAHNPTHQNQSDMNLHNLSFLLLRTHSRLVPILTYRRTEKTSSIDGCARQRPRRRRRATRDLRRGR